MKRDPAKEILIAIGKELEACGLPSDEEREKLFRALAKGRIPKEIKKRSSNKKFEFGLLAGIAEAIKLGVKKGRYRRKAELDRTLKEFKGLRYKLRPAITEAVAKIKDALPQKKRGPKPRLIDAQKQAACNTIEAFKTNGMTTKFAIEQTAKQYEITPRMMRRVWESHGRS